MAESAAVQYFLPVTIGMINLSLGLGLTVAYSIIDKHNGRLTVESEIGQGSDFTIYLPVSQKPVNEATDKENNLFSGEG